MIPPLDVATLSPQAQRIVVPSAPQKAQELAARGVAPGLRPGEIVAVLVLLAATDREGVKAAAERTLGALPEPILTGAIAGALQPQVIDVLARRYADRTNVVERLIAQQSIAVDTVEHLARTGSEAITELIATNEERLLANPSIIEQLYMNGHTRMSTADRLIELAVRNKVELSGIPAWREASLAIQNELIVEPQPEPTPEDVAFRETQELAKRLEQEELEDTHEEVEEGVEEVKQKFVPLYKRIADMKITDKIRAATIGTREERSLLVRDRNRLVAGAVVRSPLLGEDEVILFARNRNLSEEVLRIIGTTPEFVKSYSVKMNLVENPKTPIMIATRLVQHLREADLRRVAKSKNVTSPVKDAARRHLDRRSR